MRVVSGTKDGKPLFSLPPFAPVRYVLITYSGFVTVWSIDNESRDYELQGKHVNHLYIKLILYYHSSLCLFLCLSLAHNDTVHAVLFSPGLNTLVQ